MRRLALTALLVLAAAAPASAADPGPCRLAGPAGTASVVPLDLPHGAPSLALRITTPVAITAAPTSAVGTRASWHSATLVAVVRASDGALVASRALQAGSWGRRVDASGAGSGAREDVPGPTAPFAHAGGQVPDHLAPGHYYLVAAGSDGSPALPNPGWSAEADLGTRAGCVVAPTRTTVVDHDQSDFSGGTQLTSYGAGVGQGTSLTLAQRQRFFVGAIDAQAQLVGDVRVGAALPTTRLAVANSTQTFAAGRGSYRFRADWSGAFPLVLVAGVGFTPS